MKQISLTELIDNIKYQNKIFTYVINNRSDSGVFVYLAFNKPYIYAIDLMDYPYERDNHVPLSNEVIVYEETDMWNLYTLLDNLINNSIDMSWDTMFEGVNE